MRIWEWLKHEGDNVRAWMAAHPFMAAILGALLIIAMLAFLIVRWMFRAMQGVRDDVFERQRSLTEDHVRRATRALAIPPPVSMAEDEDEEAPRPQPVKTRRASLKEIPPKTGPTAWDRVLADDEEENEVVPACPPMTPPEEVSTPQKPKKKRAPRKKG